MKSQVFLILRIILLLIIVPICLYTSWDNHVWQVLGVSLIMLLVASMMSVFEKESNILIDFTLFGDMCFISSVCFLTYIVGFEHIHLQLTLLLIPIIDIVRWIYSLDERPSVDISKNNAVGLMLELITIASIIVYVFFKGLPDANTSRMLVFVAGLIILCASFFVLNASCVKYIAIAERSLSWIYIVIPISLFAWQFADEQIDGNVVNHTTIVGLLLLVAFVCDRIRFKNLRC